MSTSSSGSEGRPVGRDDEFLYTAHVVTSPYDPEDRVTDPRLRLRGLVPGVLSVLLGVVLLVLTQTSVQDVANTPLGPKFWPAMIAWAIVAFGVILLVMFFMAGLKYGDVPDPLTVWGIGRFFVAALVVVAYLLLWGVVPFWVSTLVVLVVLVWVFGARSWQALTIFPAVTTAVLHFLFVVALRVPL